MLGEADRRVGTDREARERQPIDIGASQPRALDHLAHRAPDPPMRRVGRIAPIGNGDGRADDDAAIGLSSGLCPDACHAGLAHRKSWMLPSAASQLTRSTRFKRIFSAPSIMARWWVAQAA